jgi:hypothetical protein
MIMNYEYRITKTKHPVTISGVEYQYYGTRYDKSGNPIVSAYGKSSEDVLAQIKHGQEFEETT